MMGYTLLTTAVLFGGALALLVLGALGTPVFATVYEMLRAIIATGIGLLEAFIGNTYQIWAPAKSR